MPDSPAYRTGQLFTGDRIVQIGNQSTESCDLKVAVNAIKNAGNTIQFVVQSLQTTKVPKFNLFWPKNAAEKQNWRDVKQEKKFLRRTLMTTQVPT